MMNENLRLQKEKKENKKNTHVHTACTAVLENGNNLVQMTLGGELRATDVIKHNASSIILWKLQINAVLGNVPYILCCFSSL